MNDYTRLLAILTSSSLKRPTHLVMGDGHAGPALTVRVGDELGFLVYKFDIVT